MRFVLEAADGSRRVEVRHDRPLVIRLNRQGAPSGEISVTVLGAILHLANRSDATCLVNGQVVADGDLLPGDELTLGANRYRVVSLAGDTPATTAPQPAAPVQAAHRTPPTGSSPPEVEVVDPSPPPARPSPPPGLSDSDRIRRQRRISASHQANIGAPPNTSISSGLLKRVSSVFGGRERQRMEELETERRAALVEAGRSCLDEGAGLGIPPAAMQALLAGGGVTLRATDLTGLASWREHRQRLVRLDAEIGALRAQLGLGPDPEAVVLTAPPLRSSERAKEERAYETMDGVGTQDIEPPTEPAAPPRPVVSSGRRPPPPRR
jgi:hypothetical protein